MDRHTRSTALRRTLVAAALATALIGTAGTAGTVRAVGTYTVTVLTFGATPNDTTDDTAAIQRANDDVAAHGGGVVLFPAGTYIASNVWQDSFVEFRGLSGAVLKFPNAGSGQAIVQSRLKTTTGSVVAGSNVVAVRNASAFTPGSLVAIRGASGGSKTQLAGLASTIDQSSTELLLRNAVGFSNGSTYRPNYLLIDDEIVSYQTISSDRTVGGLVRGLFGTRAGTHAAYTTVSQLLVHYSRITSLTKTKLVLADPAPFGVSNAGVYGGSSGMSIHGLTFDGSRQPDGSAAPFSVLFSLVDDAEISGNVFHDASGGAIRLDRGTQRTRISSNTFTNNGGTGQIGAAVWVFRGSRNNTVSGNNVTSETANGVFVDDRTVASTEWDLGSNGNAITDNHIDITRVGDNSAIGLFGSSDNTVRSNTLSRTYHGVRIFTENQSRVKIETARNVVEGNTMTTHVIGVWADGTNNRASSNTMSGVTKPYVDAGIGNQLGP